MVCGSNVRLSAAEVKLKQVGGVELVDHPVPVAIAHLQLGDGLGVGLVVDLGLQEFELDPLANSLARLGGVGGIFQLVGVVAHRLIEGEVGLLLDDVLNHLEPLIGAGQEALEDLLGEVEVAFVNLFIQCGGLRHELVDVGLQEVILLGVEVLEEHLDPLLGGLVVDDRLGHMLAFERGNHQLGGALVDGRHGDVGRLRAHDQSHQTDKSERRQGTQHGIDS